MRCDSSLLEIVRSHFSAICINMCHAIERTSYTTYVTESGDFTALLVSPDGRQFMYPRTAGVAGFLGLTLNAALEAVGGAEALREGDIIISNDPYATCGLSSHLPDISLFKPVYAEGRLVCFLWAFIHSSDVGGSVPTSLRPDATDIQMEGQRIPPVHLYREGELNGAVRSIVLAASRQPQLLLGDINCMVSAMNVGEERMLDCIRKFGVQTVLDAQADLLEIAEQRARAVIATIPDGAYAFEDYLDDDYVTDTPLRIAVDLRVEGEALTLDFSRSDPQTASAFNLVTGGSHHPYLYQGLINFIVSQDPFIPLNAGLTEPIRVVAPEGTVMNAQYPAACGLRHPLSMRLFSAALGALAQAIPERVQACGASQADIVSLSVPDESRGGVMSAIVVEPIGGGDGGQAHVDGIDGIDHSTGFLRNTPIETIENRTSVVVERYEFVPDTAGAGQHRGGSALRLDFRPTVERALVGSRGKGHVKFQPYGLAGGRAGQLGSSVLNPGTAREQVVAKLAMQPIGASDVISITTPSGGGWGDPRLREPFAVLDDVADGLISIGKAADDYGVAIVEREGVLAVDEEATAQLRENMAPSEEAIDIGDARRAYERVWTPEASDELAALSQTIPTNRRPIRKQQVHDHFAARTAPLSAADIQSAWALYEQP